MLQHFLDFSFWGNSGVDLFNSLLYFLGAIIVLKIFQLIVLARLRELAKRTKNDFDDVLIDIFNNIKPPFYVIAAFYIGVKSLSMPDMAWQIAKILFIVVLTYEIIRGLQSIVDYLVYKMMMKDREENQEEGEDGLPPENAGAIKAIGSVVKILLWVFAVLIVLANLGVNITSVVAGLGIGGIAVALAIQNILGDIFSSFSIIIDKPFKVGDFIIIGQDMGVVERIGIKTTRIRTLQGEELVVSNKELTSTRVQNFKRMEKRRIVFNLGVIYETPKIKLEKISSLVQKIINEVELTEFDRCHFKNFGDFSLIYEVVYYLNSSDYNIYMDVQQEINLKIFEVFAKEGIEFAYPTQVEYQKKLSS